MRAGAVKLGFAGLGLTFALASAQLFASQPEKEAPNAQPSAAPAAGAPTPPADTPALRAKGRELFSTWGCNSCHTLADAGATGHVGPELDHNPNLTQAFVVDRVSHGQGAMPSFGGQMTDQEIADIAAYITVASAK